jgi:hypothetical protein
LDVKPNIGGYKALIPIVVQIINPRKRERERERERERGGGE